MWIATTFTDDGFSCVGETPDSAARAFAEKFGEPLHGFSIFDNRNDYKKELMKMAPLIGDGERISIFQAANWHIIVPVSEMAVEDLQGGATAKSLLHDWTAADDTFRICSPRERFAPPPRELTPAQQRRIERRRS